jgi:hypothetical protein
MPANHSRRTGNYLSMYGHLSRTITALESAILEILHQRAPNKTICPSEAAKKVAGTQAKGAWQPLMEPARTAAQSLVAAGQIQATQHGHPIDLTTAKGPIRLRLRENKL